MAVALRDAQVEARLEELPVETRTTAAAARALGCEETEIVKSIVFVCDGRPVLALVPGDRRAAPARVAHAVEAAHARTASPDEVLAATGFAAGGVAPFPRPGFVRAVLDETILDLVRVWIGAGTSRHMAQVAVPDLLRVARAEPASVVE